MTDAEAWKALEADYEAHKGEGFSHPQLDLTNISRLEVVDNVLSVEMSLASDWYDDEVDVFKRTFDVAYVEVDSLGKGCDTCGYGSSYLFQMTLP